MEVPLSEHPARPFAPSALHRLLTALAASPVPRWLAYVTLACFFVFLEIAVKLADGSFPTRFRLIHLILPIFAAAMLPALDLFSSGAARAMDEARPLLMLTQEDFDRYRYRLMHIPSRSAFGAAIGGLACLFLLTLLQPDETFATLGTMTSPLNAGLEWTFQILTWTGVGVVAWFIFRQMLMINEVTSQHTRIDIFSLGPIYSFSRLTASHALFTATAVTLATLALSRLARTPQWAVFGGVPLLLAAATFVVPLLGVRRLIVLAKREPLERLGRHIEGLLRELDTRLTEGHLAGIEDVKDAIEATSVAEQKVMSISTWPWQAATIRTVVSAVLAPLVIWVITRLLESFFF